jgi:hypothetical protein
LVVDRRTIPDYQLQAASYEQPLLPIPNSQFLISGYKLQVMSSRCSQFLIPIPSYKLQAISNRSAQFPIPNSVGRGRFLIPAGYQTGNSFFIFSYLRGKSSIIRNKAYILHFLHQNLDFLNHRG